MKPRHSMGRHRTPLIRLFFGGLATLAFCAACSNSPSSPTSSTGIPAEMTLGVTMITTAQRPTASIAALVRDSGGAAVSGLSVTFSTTSGFITSGTKTGTDGIALAILTGAAGTSPTVTASVTSDTQTVSASTVVRF